jgi:hypothetical protein
VVTAITSGTEDTTDMEVLTATVDKIQK